MATADDIFDQSFNNLERLGLRAIPFTASPTNQSSETLQQVFTGREKDLRQVFNQFTSRERRRILVSGRIGIGKSAFLLEVLGVLDRKLPDLLTTYISLPNELDLATTALIAVAKALPNDDWAQQQLYRMGIPTSKVLKARSAEVSGSMGIGGKLGEQDLPITAPEYPAISLDTLLERAREKYPRGVVIAIDDLDKQNPSRVRQLMHDAQGTLKGQAWYLLTGHPLGMTADMLTSERGLFDLQLPLEELDPPTTYQMLINYLNSVRINNDCADPADPRAVLPFTPETARRLCEESRGKPRLFNRLGNAVLAKAADLRAKTITPDVLELGLQASARTRIQEAALGFQEERLRQMLQERGSLSDEDITLDELRQLGFSSFSEVMPLLEKLENFDLAYQLPQEDATTFEALVLPPLEDEASEA